MREASSCIFSKGWIENVGGGRTSLKSRLVCGFHFRGGKTKMGSYAWKKNGFFKTSDKGPREGGIPCRKNEVLTGEKGPGAWGKKQGGAETKKREKLTVASRRGYKVISTERKKGKIIFVGNRIAFGRKNQGLKRKKKN